MSLTHSMRVFLKDAERASKREHFDPSSIAHPPKRPWLNIEVGQSFEVDQSEMADSSIRHAAWEWSNKTGRVYSVKKSGASWLVTRTA